MQIALFFFGFIIAVPSFIGFMIIFPQHYYAFLAMIYAPDIRITVLATILIVYILYLWQKKHTKHSYDYFNDLQMMQGGADGVIYHYKLQNRKEEENFENLESIILFVDGNCGYDFSLKFETRFEKLLKSWRLSHECQSGDKRFDEMIYIVSDEPDLCRYMKHNEELRKSVFELFWEQKQRGYLIKSLHYFDGRIILTCKVNIDTKDADTFLESSVVKLNQIIAHLPSRCSQEERLYRERTAFFSHVFYLFLGAFFLNGMLKLFLDSTSTFFLPRVVDKTELFLPVIVMSMVFMALYLLLALIIFKKSTRLARVLSLGVTLGTIGFVLTSLTGVKEINIYWDDSDPMYKSSTLVSKHIRKGKNTTYYVTFQGYSEMRVPSWFYRKFDLNETVMVKEKMGYLGIPWIAGFEHKNLAKVIASKKSIIHPIE